jgi:diaminohydroxyphosphoribosylaminopyrimidine deaminase / 5-amino-6-(5-phosphoribosylamino)uracil reductase
MNDRGTFDRHMMAIALTMARRGLGQTAPNPSVGSVIADEVTGEVIARAVTAPGGRPHAETIAIAEAGSRAEGATLYVTLEPCSHHGHTAPCADAVIASGIARVVVAILDPDPRVAGRGIDRLRAAGIQVDRGLGADEARWLTRGHIVRVTERRPFITLKMALNSSGHVSRGTDGKPVWVTGEAARAHGHLLRAQSDAILVGAGTVRDDNPDLTCRLPGLANRSPERVVLSRNLDLPLECKLTATARQVPVWIVCGYGADAALRAAFEAKGAYVIPVNEVGGRLWLPAVMEALIERGITRLLVEGGPATWRAFADASLADEVALFMANVYPGSDPAGLTPCDEVKQMGGVDGSDPDLDRPRAALATHLGELPFECIEHRALGPDTLYAFRKTSSRSTL